MKIIVVTCISVLCGCAGLTRDTREAVVEQLDEHGLSSPMLLVDPGSMLRFVNADARPHQVYSNDCGEVSSTLLNPGDVYSTQLGAGVKECHFQDLLAPLDAGYSGTLQVRAEETRSPLEGPP